MMEMLKKMQAWWYLKDAHTRANYIRYTTFGVIFLFLLGVYFSRGGDEPKPVVNDPNLPQQGAVAVSPVEALQADVREGVKDQMAGYVKSDDVKRMVAEALQNNSQLPGEIMPQPAASAAASAATPASSPATDELASLGSTDGQAQPFSYPEPPANATPVQGGQAPVDGQPTQSRFGYIGGIAQPELPVDNDPGKAVSEKKSQNNQIQLPVGFMPARLLVGVNALVGEFAQENPQTVMFRVQAPAQLPNFIRMNLRGCFSIANVHGNLSAERIFVFPISMHCMTMDGRYIVEGAIKGFVSDKDGKRDMSAHVVSRAGSLLASAVFAKTVEGFANVSSQDGYETNTSALGSVSTLKSDEMAKTAATQGVAGGVSELGTYLLDLAKQTTPVLETGPGKTVALYIQETATLEIKEVRIK